jgi:uncharacterized membrane protein YkvA (DUF1232 family)
MEESSRTYLDWLKASAGDAGRTETDTDVLRCLHAAPSLLSLLLAVLRDAQIPPEVQRTAASVLSYFLLPTDFSPEAFLGIHGVKDDVFFVALFLDSLRARGLFAAVEKLWKGEGPLDRCVNHILGTETRLVTPEIATAFRNALKTAR